MANFTPPYVVGDIIRHTRGFLRSIAWHTEVPINGQVIAVEEAADGAAKWQRLTVEWSDGTTSTIIAANVEFCPRGRALNQSRREGTP